MRVSAETKEARALSRRAWAPEPDRQIRSFTCRKNLESQVWEIHLRGVKAAEVSIFTVAGNPRALDAIVDQLHGIHHRAIKFLDEHPEATLAPATEATPAAIVPSLEDLG